MRERFPLSSDQMELLLAFEKAGSLEALSDLMAKDASVISRRLKELSAAMSVLLKVGGRWQITSLGRQVNELNRRYMADLQRVIPTSGKDKVPSVIPAGSVLIVINAQKALHFSSQRKRSNLKAEENILALLKYWRKQGWPVLHVKHLSMCEESVFHKNSSGSQFIAGFEALAGELVIEKQKASAFVKTSLEKKIHTLKAPSIVLTGFTAGECIDATARQASDLDIPTFVIADATATFDLVGPTGKVHKAEKVHRATMAHLHAGFVDVIETASALP